MTEVVISDTNVLIDLVKAGLLDAFFKLDLDFRTIDFVMNELTDADERAAVERHVRDGRLRVDTLQEDALLRANEYRSRVAGTCNLSFVDCSVIVYAKEAGARLLSGDRTLRSHAVEEGIQVNGILYVVHLLAEKGVLSSIDAVEKLELLKKVNARLPHKDMNDMIAEFSRNR